MSKLTKLFQLALVVLGISAFAPAVQAKTYTLDLTKQSGTMESGNSQTIDGVTISIIDTGKIYWGGDWIANSGSTFSFSLASGANMTRIEMTCTVSVGLGGAAGWNETTPGYVWTGNAKSVLTGSYFEGVTKIVVTSDEPDPARAPDYAEATGGDWLYNHAIAGKAYAGEAAESGVDLFYVYPTLAGGEQIVIKGFRGIDDATMRSKNLTLSTAAGAFTETGCAFADLTHVYAPYYRQLTLAGADDISTNAQGEVVSDANASYLKKLAEGPAYADVTNALTVYFAKWNKGRQLVLAGHSQGSALLRLVMRDYFTLPENQNKAKQVICSYQIGFGVSAAEMSDITTKTGVAFAQKADDTNVIVSYNTMGEDSSGSSVLLPPDTLAINPLTWTTGRGLAKKDLNLGALTNELGKADVIVPHLYGAQVVDTGFNRGYVVVCKELNGEVMEPGIFGTGSLHVYDYGAYWEDLHKNCYDRIAAATGKAPVVGKPMDYAGKNSWLRLGDRENNKSTAKPFDIFYLYPTSTGSSEYVAPVGDDMKERALGAYRQAVEPLESYANVFAPYYRQISATGIMADPTADGLQQNIARHVGKTDVFAALDYYFANVNVNAKRPFVLASHSQGSAALKNAFEQYFVDEKAAYLEKMIAAYTVGYTFSTDWCTKYGVTFATGAADTGVLLTWNAEGPDAPALANMLTKDPNGQAINPLNWKRDETYAAITENLGSFSTSSGTRVAGAADAQLKTARPGAVVVTNQTGYSYAPVALFGAKSYHLNDWAMFRENACANILDRGKDLTSYAKLCTTNFPKHLCVSNATVYLTGSSLVVDPVAGTVWIPTNGFISAIANLVPEKGYRIMYSGIEFPVAAPIAIATEFLQPNGEFLIPSKTMEMLKVEYIQRAPDYADATGKDWLFNHDIEAKRDEGAPAADPGVDLFYLYPTSVKVSDDHCVDGICDIDDEYLRSEKGALDSWKTTGKVFGDFTHVYAPYYRQMPVDKEMTFPKDETGYDKIMENWYERASYTDVTNALAYYFTKINPNGERPFILAGHGQGSGLLALAMKHFFEDRQELLGNMVACYAIGMGVSTDWEAAVKGYAPIATNATDAGVYVFWNTEGPGANQPSILWPANPAASVNPITWSREEASAAPVALNLGGWTADDSGAIRPGLYDASNNVTRGTVICSYLTGRYQTEYGMYSLHKWNYKLYWENLRANALQRIKTMNAKMGNPDYVQIPFAGKPIDYADADNWVTNTGCAKPLDVLYVYPTMMKEGDSTIVPVTDAMKAKAYTAAYDDAASAFAGYANVLIPAYRQLHQGVVTAAQTLYTEPRDFLEYVKGQTMRTDLFAALDYYFTKLNGNGKRPYILAGHAQGSAMLKIALEDYFRSSSARKGYLANMVATYGLGHSFSQDWFDTYYSDTCVTFAADAASANVLVSWNTEGTNATTRSRALEKGALAINPMTWTTTADVWSETNPDAMIQKRTATDYDYGENTYALVTTNVDASAYLDPAKGMGEKSLHDKDWSLWYNQIKANGFARFAASTGLKRVSGDTIPSVADTTWKVEMSSDGKTWSDAIMSPVGDYYIDGTAETRKARVVYTLSPEKAAEGNRFTNGLVTVSFPMLYASKGFVWIVADDIKPAIAAATKMGLPTLKLGVVAQRYPWNGIVDVNYKAMYWPEGNKPCSDLEITIGETVLTNAFEILGTGEVIDSLAIDMKEFAPETINKAKVKAFAYIPGTSTDVRRKVSPAAGGVVVGGQQCTWGAETEITAVPNEGYLFDGWSDGVKTQARTVTADGKVYQANFHKLLQVTTLGRKQDGYPFFDQVYRFVTNGIDDASSPYKDWAANFFVSFSKKIPAKTLKLATKCGAAEWDQSIKGDVLEADTEYELTDAGTYGDLCGKQKLDFGVWTYDNRNLDTTMTIWFKMTNGTETVKQKLAEHTFKELVKVIIRPSGVTEETAPYAVEMPVGSSYYVITNYTCKVTDTVLTMTGLTGRETVQLNYLCNFVSNANENTTFLVMSYPKKDSKGKYIYNPEVIPGSMDVCKGFDYSTKVFNTALNHTVGERDWAITEFTGDLGLTKPGAAKVSGTGGSQDVTLKSVTIDDANVTFVATGAVESMVEAPAGLTLSGIGMVEVWPQSNAGEVTCGHILGYSNVTFTVNTVTTSTDSQTATYTATADRWDYVDDMPIGDLVKHWVGLPSPPVEGAGTNTLAILEADIKLSYVLMKCTNLVEQDWTTVSSIEKRAESSVLHLTDSLYRKGQMIPQAFYKYQVAK